MSVTISAKITRNLREKLRERGIDVSRVVRNALEDEIARREEEELRLEVDNVSKLVAGNILLKKSYKL